MLDAPSEDESDEEAAERCAAPRSNVSEDLQFMRTEECISNDLAELEISDEEYASDTSTIRPDYAAFDEEGNEFWFIDDSPLRPDSRRTAPPTAPELDMDDGSDSGDSSSDEDDDADSVGDTIGVNPYDDEEVFVTQ
jgi:hypothetical protein